VRETIFFEKEMAVIILEGIGEMYMRRGGLIMMERNNDDGDDSGEEFTVYGRR